MKCIYALLRSPGIIVIHSCDNERNTFKYGSEEFYDHCKDPNEWNKPVMTGDVKEETGKLKIFLPEKNVLYAKYSFYDFNPFFRQDRLNHSQ